MRYYLKCKLNPVEKDRLAKGIKFGSLASGKIFYEGMQSALRSATIDEDDVVHFIEICYCLEGGLYPMAMEIPVLNEYFEKVSEVKDARFRDQCTMECEFCDCTRNIKLPGKPLLDEWGTLMSSQPYHDIPTTNFIDIGRIELTRKKQKEGVYPLKSLCNDKSYNKLKPIFAGAAISGLFAIFHDGTDYFRIKNVPDSAESREILRTLGLEVYDSVDSIKSSARSSLACSDKRSNVV
ncbi:MAG: hypothetical protein M3Y53_10050 [Thermoproteota archaeon]|nr:hypothetical protein [Thermoproteota archaeon]